MDASLAFENIQIDTNTGDEDLRRNRKLARAGTMLLMEVSDQAIIAAVAAELDLSEESVEIVSESIVSNVTNVATVLVEFKILAPAQGFSTYEACFAHFSVKLSDTEGIHDQVLVAAEDMGAFELYHMSNVTVLGLANSGAIDTKPADRDDISEGDFAGVVIGIVVAFLVLAVLMYLCISGCGGGGGASAQPTAAAAGNHDIKV